MPPPRAITVTSHVFRPAACACNRFQKAALVTDTLYRGTIPRHLSRDRDRDRGTIPRHLSRDRDRDRDRGTIPRHLDRITSRVKCAGLGLTVTEYFMLRCRGAAVLVCREAWRLC
jgi:hypothetical protein